MDKLKNEYIWKKTGVSMFMGKLGTTIFMTHTVDEILWGFKDVLLSHLHTLKPEVEEYFGLMLNVCISIQHLTQIVKLT